MTAASTIKRRSRIFFPLVLLLALSNTAMAEAQMNPLTHYFVNGQLVGPWQWVAGNEANYYVPLGAGAGQSEDGVLQVSRADYQGKEDAVRAVWNEENKGTYLYLQAPAIDLNEFENVLAIAADFRIEKKPRRFDMTISMDCSYPCRGKVDIGRNFRSKPKNEWFTFPVPLNCFSGEDFDLGKIRSPFMLWTPNELTISIANVRLVLLPEGETGCKK